MCFQIATHLSQATKEAILLWNAQHSPMTSRLMEENGKMDGILLTSLTSIKVVISLNIPSSHLSHKMSPL